MGELKVTNLDSSPLLLQDLYVTIPVGGTVTADRTSADLLGMKSLSGALVALKASYTLTHTAAELATGLFNDVTGVNLDSIADAIGGATTTVVGLQSASAREQLLELVVFDDLDVSVPATNATLATATEGTIVAGSGTAGLKIKTDTAGRFTCTMTNAVDETVSVTCLTTPGGPTINCDSIESASYSA